MQRRGQFRVWERVTTGTSLLAFVLALALLSFSCAGGSGSSGFDIAENEAIDMALDEQRCVESDGLTICPAGSVMEPAPDSTMTRTATPPSSTPTPTKGAVDSPTRTPPTPPAQTPSTTDPTPTATSTRTSPTPTPTGGDRMNVDTSFDGTEGSTCFPTDTPGICLLPFTFVPEGFSNETHYQVAVRSTENEPWELFEALQISFDAVTSVFQADIPIDTRTQGPMGIVIQTAVLVFVDRPPLLPAFELVELLSESGADFAFVDPPEELELVIP